MKECHAEHIVFYTALYGKSMGQTIAICEYINRLYGYWLVSMNVIA